MNHNLILETIIAIVCFINNRVRMIKHVNMSHLLSLTVQLATQSCAIVENCYMNKSVKHFMKGKNDPVTEADFKVQTMLIRGFRKHYPTIKIVGEEETEYEGHIECDYEQFKFPFLPISNIAAREVPEEELCIWIDPIDNTKGFINGNIEDVTVLIGISHKQKAEMGIVGIPFKKVGDKAIYDPSVVIGSVTDKLAYEYFSQKGEWVRVVGPENQDRNRIVTSPHRESELEKRIIEKLHGQWLRVGGSGSKIMMVAKQAAEMALYAQSWTQKWDSCAGEAIIHSMNGIFTSQFGDRILYDPQEKSYQNREGFICTFNEKNHSEAVAICKQYAKK